MPKPGTFITVNMLNDQVKDTPWYLAPRAMRVRGSAVGSIQEFKEVQELASKKNVRLIIQKLLMTKSN